MGGRTSLGLLVASPVVPLFRPVSGTSISVPAGAVADLRDTRCLRSRAACSRMEEDRGLVTLP
jgi:hypothetical protein